MSAGAFITTDVFGTFVLLEAARESPRLRRFVQISTDEVYGSVAEGSSRETDELRPRNPYSASKAAADRLAYSYWATYEVPVVITRASNNYGPFHFPEKVIPLFITNAIDNIPVPLYGDGRQERDWLHVVRSLSGRRSVDRWRHAGRGLQRWRRQPCPEHRPDASEFWISPANLTSLIQPVADRPGHDRRYSLDTSKLQTTRLAPAGRVRCRASRHGRRGIERTSGGGVRSRRTTRRSAPITTRSTASAASDRLPCLVLLWSRAPPVSRAAISSTTCSKTSRRSRHGLTSRDRQTHLATDARESCGARSICWIEMRRGALADLSPSACITAPASRMSASPGRSRSAR